MWHVTDETLAFRAVGAGIEASRSHSFVCDAYHTHIMARIPRKGLQTDVLIVMLSGSKHEPPDYWRISQNMDSYINPAQRPEWLKPMF